MITIKPQRAALLRVGIEVGRHGDFAPVVQVAAEGSELVGHTFDRVRAKY
jgi:hypothetical protein